MNMNGEKEEIAGRVGKKPGWAGYFSGVAFFVRKTGGSAQLWVFWLTLHPGAGTECGAVMGSERLRMFPMWRLVQFAGIELLWRVVRRLCIHYILKDVRQSFWVTFPLLLLF